MCEGHLVVVRDFWFATLRPGRRVRTVPKHDEFDLIR